MADQSLASAPMSMSSSICFTGSPTYLAVGVVSCQQPSSVAHRLGAEASLHPVNTFSKQTSKAASACDVKTVLFSPAISLARPYSLPTASMICRVPSRG